MLKSTANLAEIEFEVDCCDIARICDGTDQIILFEGEWANENVAGTLSLPDPGHSILVLLQLS